MELNWTTFILEIVNFLLLVWILAHFFYRPVQQVIAGRRAAIEQSMAEAKARREEADAIEQQYRNRLQAWEKERAAAHQALQHDIDGERTRMLQALQDELQQQRDKAAVLEQRREAAMRREAENDAWDLADRFLRRMLQQLAVPALQQRIIELCCAELAELPEERAKALADAWSDPEEAVNITTAWELDDSRQQAIRNAFEQRLGPADKQWQFRSDPQLIAGLHASIGAWTLAANLRDELRLFREAGHAGD